MGVPRVWGHAARRERMGSDLRQAYGATGFMPTHGSLWSGLISPISLIGPIGSRSPGRSRPRRRPETTRLLLAPSSYPVQSVVAGASFR